MKLIGQHYDTTTTIETNHDDVTLSQAIEMMESLLVAMGYSRKRVDEYLGVEEDTCEEK